MTLMPFLSIFQFHKGTIKTFTLTLETSVLSDFNSIKVQLKHTQASGKAGYADNFNSIKVQLKPLTGGLYVPSSSQFQFHKGTIKTRLRSRAKVVYHYFNSIKVQLKLCRPSQGDRRREFQFHKGTIKTRWSVLPLRRPQHFNSIKVQLKHA